MPQLVKDIDGASMTDFQESVSPFELENQTEYQTWRNAKLESYRCHDPAKIVHIPEASAISTEALNNLAQQMQAFNYAIFEIGSGLHDFSMKSLLELGAVLGLLRFESSTDQEVDGVTTLTVVDDTDKRSRYIPYSPRGLNWHTDGYYNPEFRQIRSFILYCVCPAAVGGDSFLLDHEILYSQIRDKAPDLLAALMAHDALVVPANIQNAAVTRAAESGPVFSVDESTGQLAMRYSSRPRNIEWKKNERTMQAVDLISDLLRENQFAVRLKLKPGQGLICRNVLHGRKAYEDDSGGESIRRFYRVRYYDNPGFPDNR